MGRTVPTFRNIIESFVLDWGDFKKALRNIDSDAFEEIINHARRHAAAGSNMSSPNPFEPIVMSVLVEHEKTIRKLREYVERKHS
jgi:hypothetical protein